MPKVIKFRAWDIRLKKMIYDIQKCSELRSGHSLTELLNYPDYFDIMQYIALDINNKEIYEGDIIKGFVDFSEREEEELGKFECIYQFIDEIRYRHFGYYCEKADLPLDHYQKIEVLGNIYEHPHLLES